MFVVSELLFVKGKEAGSLNSSDSFVTSFPLGWYVICATLYSNGTGLFRGSG